MVAQAPVAILGAGFAGLVAARELQRRGVKVEVFEASPRVAGLATSFREDDGFTYDFGAHFITNRLATQIGVASRCRVVRRYGETVVLGTRSYSYPLGLLRSPKFVISAIRSRMARGAHVEPPSSASEWFRQTYGTALADAVAIPLVEAWSGESGDDLAPSVGDKLPGSVHRTALLKLASIVTRKAVASGYCQEQPESVGVWHVYPEGGVATLCEHLAAELGPAVHLECRVEQIFVENGRVVAIRAGGRDREVSAAISTAPVNVLAKLAVGTNALDDLRKFRYRPMVFVNIRLAGRGLIPDVVTWTPESYYPFFRLTEPTLSMPWLAPAGKTLLTADIGCEVGDSVWTMADTALTDLCVDHLMPIIPDVRRRLLGSRVLRTPLAYPVFLRAYEASRQRLARSTGITGLFSIGRNGEFAHLLMEDVYWRTLRRVRDVLQVLHWAA